MRGNRSLRAAIGPGWKLGNALRGIGGLCLATARTRRDLGRTSGTHGDNEDDDMMVVEVTEMEMTSQTSKLRAGLEEEEKLLQ